MPAFTCMPATCSVPYPPGSADANAGVDAGECEAVAWGETCELRYANTCPGRMGMGMGTGMGVVWGVGIGKSHAGVRNQRRCMDGAVQTGGAADLALTCTNGLFSAPPLVTCTAVANTCALPDLADQSRWVVVVRTEPPLVAGPGRAGGWLIRAVANG
jgi:hypothetical protein